MDAVAYQVSFDKEQLALLCANYDRRIDSLGAENKRLSAENAKLREQIHWLKQGDILHVLTDQEYIDQCERERLMQVSIDALDKENAKLRELMRWAARILTGIFPYVDYSRCTALEAVAAWKVEASKLGIEVDE